MCYINSLLLPCNVCLGNDISLEAEWIPRESNKRADMLQRVAINHFIFETLNTIWGPHNCGRFVIRDLHFLIASAVDAFTHNWSSANNLLCPPIGLVVLVVRKLLSLIERIDCGQNCHDIRHCTLPCDCLFYRLPVPEGQLQKYCDSCVLSCQDFKLKWGKGNLVIIPNNTAFPGSKLHCYDAIFDRLPSRVPVDRNSFEFVD